MSRSAVNTPTSTPTVLWHRNSGTRPSVMSAQESWSCRDPNCRFSVFLMLGSQDQIKADLSSFLIGWGRQKVPGFTFLLWFICKHAAAVQTAACLHEGGGGRVLQNTAAHLLHMCSRSSSSFRTSCFKFFFLYSRHRCHSVNNKEH